MAAKKKQPGKRGATPPKITVRPGKEDGRKVDGPKLRKRPPEERMAMKADCEMMVRASWPTGQIKAALKNKYKLRHRAAMNYIRRAQNVILAEADVEPRVLTATLLVRLQTIIQHSTDDKTIMRAVDSISRLFGLYGGRFIHAPVQTEQRDDSDEPLDARRARILSLVSEARRRLGTGDAGARAYDDHAADPDVPASAERETG